MIWGFNMSIRRPLSDIRRPASPFTIRVVIISDPINCISVKFQFQVDMGLNQGGNGDFGEKSCFLIIGEVFNFSLTLYPMRAKTAERYSSLRLVVERNGVKFGPRGVSIQCVQRLSTVKCLGVILGSLGAFPIRQGYISKTAGRRAKRNEIWPSGARIQCLQGTFDT